MRKLFFVLTMLILSEFSFGQAINDNAVVPISVTLNSILRLTVTSGGNIQFVVNTLKQYTDGIGAPTQYMTTFRVSSSRKYRVKMIPEIATGFTGLETGNASLFKNQNIGYTLGGAGSGAFTPAAGTLIALADASATIIDNPAGAGNQIYTITWELNTLAVQGLAGSLPSLLALSLPSDVYVQNIFLTLGTY